MQRSWSGGAGRTGPAGEHIYNVGEMDRHMTPLDRLLGQADLALRASFGRPATRRPSPGDDQSDRLADEAQRRHAAGLMRVNHAGEVAAQGLYHGQALTARDGHIRRHMLEAARDEGDHLAWCRDRLRELGSGPSLLNPLWYAGSFVIGALAGAAGDRVSLGFVAETERQVEGHLEDHLRRLPEADERSRAILDQMKTDEVGHADAAVAAGGAELPMPVKRLMRMTAGVMTRTAYWF